MFFLGGGCFFISVGWSRIWSKKLEKECNFVAYECLALKKLVFFLWQHFFVVVGWNRDYPPGDNNYCCFWASWPWDSPLIALWYVYVYVCGVWLYNSTPLMNSSWFFSGLSLSDLQSPSVGGAELRILIPCAFPEAFSLSWLLFTMKHWRAIVTMDFSLVYFHHETLKTIDLALVYFFPPWKLKNNKDNRPCFGSWFFFFSFVGGGGGGRWRTC